MIEVETEVLHQRPQEEQGWPPCKDEQHEQHGQHQVKLGQAPHAPVGAAQHREGGSPHYQRDDPYLHGGGVRQAVVVREPRRHLRDAEPQRRGDAKDRAADREDVDRIADRATDALAKDREQSGAKRQGQALAVGEIGKAQAYQRIDRPGMDAIVMERDRHGFAGRVDGAGLRFRRRAVVLDRLGHREIHEADTHPRGEKHREPRHVGKVGLGIVRAEPQPSRRTETQGKDDDEKGDDGCYIKPAESSDRPGLRSLEYEVRSTGSQQRAAKHRSDDSGGAPEDARVHSAFDHCGSLACSGRFYKSAPRDRVFLSRHLHAGARSAAALPP